MASTSITTQPLESRLRARHRHDLRQRRARDARRNVCSEVLGSGDASPPHQRFALRQPPLTYVQAAIAERAPSPRSSVRVNDIALARSAVAVRTARRAIASTSPAPTDDGDDDRAVRRRRARRTAADRTRRTCARSYRKGIGTRRHCRGRAAQHAVDAAARRPRRDQSDAPRRAPPIRSRSLDARTQRAADGADARPHRLAADYEDFARAFAGIAKALATWTWDWPHAAASSSRWPAPNGAEIAPTATPTPIC